jgi:hypothetical protein
LNRLVDVDHMAFAVLLGAFGIVGITGTANISPNIFASATCNCIPSPLARLQELSVVLLVFGAILAPIGLTRRAARADSSIESRAHDVLPSGRSFTGHSMRSGGLFTLGVSLVVFGIGVVVPSLLVLGNSLLVSEGAAMTALMAAGALGIGISIDSVVHLIIFGASAPMVTRLTTSLCLLAGIVAVTIVLLRRIGMKLAEAEAARSRKVWSELELD